MVYLKKVSVLFSLYVVGFMSGNSIEKLFVDYSYWHSIYAIFLVISLFVVGSYIVLKHKGVVVVFGESQDFENDSHGYTVFPDVKKVLVDGVSVESVSCCQIRDISEN